MGHNVNIKYVAERAKVSISTVSRVLNNSANVSDALKERVHRAIEETQFQVNPIASSLKSARRNQMAVVIPSLRQILYTDIIKGFSDFCYQRQITPVILESGGVPGKERQIIDSLAKQWVDGIVYIPSHSAKTPEAQAFFASLSQLKKQDNAIPVVLAECDGAGLELDCVRVDYENAFYQMAYHLLEIGRRHMAYLSGSKDSPLHDMCRKAVNRAHHDFGCQLVGMVARLSVGYGRGAVSFPEQEMGEAVCRCECRGEYAVCQEQFFGDGRFRFPDFSFRHFNRKESKRFP